MNQTSDSPATIRKYRRLASTVTKSFFGREPSRIVYKRSGLTNYVFAVNHVEGQFVIRLSPDPERINAFTKELWATQKVRQIGVPTPEVLAVGNTVVPTPYMISRRVSGTEATHHPKRLEIIREMGRYASLINSIQTHGFGKDFDWHEEKQFTRLSWTDYLDQEWLLADRFRILQEQRMLLSRQLKVLQRIIDEARKLEEKPALNHGDLRLKNVIVDEDGEIAAIVDWEDSLSTIAPHWDVSIALHDLSLDEKDLFIEGYGLSHGDIEDMAPLLKAFNILNYANTIKLAVEKQDHKTLAECQLRLHGCLDLFSL